MSNISEHEATLEHAQKLDQEDELRHLRKEFIIPTKSDLKRSSLKPSAAATPKNENKKNKHSTTFNSSDSDDTTPSIYLCGNSLGLQPILTQHYILAHLHTWAQKGVYGHFTPLTSSPLPPWLDLDTAVTGPMASIVGALPLEVAVMQTLTANLHLLMASFYRPTKERHKIILEGKAFPSDHYVVESQIRHHDLEPATSMVLIEPLPETAPLLTTEQIIQTIDKHADETALILLPGVQFYTGQALEVERITAHAHEKGIVIGWDLAHAAGNVTLRLHDWNVDFAAWCTYKYLNCGPGAIGGLFVHERHGQVRSPLDVEAVDQSAIDTSSGNDDDNVNNNNNKDNQQKTNASSLQPHPQTNYTPRLSGWWGHVQPTRFAMSNNFTPTPGAAGWQLSNPSGLDMAAVMASLAVFGMTSMEKLRAKSLRLTGYLERLLGDLSRRQGWEDHGNVVAVNGGSKANGVIHPPPSSEEEQNPATPQPFRIITPPPPNRGAQLSILLAPQLLQSITTTLEREGVVIDERRPDVIRVAPAPLYNSFEDVWRFVDVFGAAVEGALRDSGGGGGGGGKSGVSEAVGQGPG